MATKEKETDFKILAIPDDVLDQTLEVIKLILPKIYNLKKGNIKANRCEICDYCKSTKILDKIIDFRDI